MPMHIGTSRDRFSRIVSLARGVLKQVQHDILGLPNTCAAAEWHLSPGLWPITSAPLASMLTNTRQRGRWQIK